MINHKLNKLKISTPGRVCLFGEHQDYLHLPIVACAISLRIYVEGVRRNDMLFNIQLPDISKEESFFIDKPIVYSKERDYFKSSLKVLLRKGYTFSSGFDCVINGQIPINAGTSSSSALIVTWINFLTRMSDQSEILSDEKLAQFAYEAEVLEFSEPGGMMDQYSTSIGGIIAIDFFPELNVSRLNTELKSFVLGNSLQPKDTKYILSHVKNKILEVDKILRSIDPDFNLQSFKEDDLNNYTKHLNQSQFQILEGTIKNRELTVIARKELANKNPDHKIIGQLLTEHHIVLRDILNISTPKIEMMINAAIKAGAYGAKINGSGGGGCMFAYSPDYPERVKSAIENAGGEAFIILPDSGSREELPEEAK
ncbi:MAG: galactokinase family protein [Ignavibacterium sp.]|nr:galactokinase family protein [Ignavibacterium sp.]